MATTWISAFLWIRSNTPKEAVFAVDPNYMVRPGEDAHGFRAMAERSVLADYVKDSGAVSLFPKLAAEWEKQVGAERGIDRFEPADFQRLLQRYPVTWILTTQPGPAGLTCPYRNTELAVCRMLTYYCPDYPRKYRHNVWSVPSKFTESAVGAGVDAVVFPPRLFCPVPSVFICHSVN